MAYTERALVTVALDGAGAAVVYSPVARGTIDSVRFVDLGTLGTPTVLAVLEGDDDDDPIWSEASIADTYHRRITVPVAGTDGADDPAAKTRVVASGRRISFAITGGTASGAGTIEVVLEGSFSGA